MLYKPSGSTNILITEKMATAAPLAIGTRGTVGSLVRREIEYFRRVELDHATTSKKPESKNFVSISSASTNSSSTSSSRSKTNTLGSFFTMSWRRRRSRRSNSNSNNNNNNSTYLPRMCAAVEVSESKRFDVIPGFSYRNLKADIQKTAD